MKLSEDIRTGVFVCDCGSNIAGYLDCPSLAEYSETLPNVVFVKENLYTCSETGINEIKNAIKDAILDGEIPNDFEAARGKMLDVGLSLGLTVHQELRKEDKRDSPPGADDH